MSPLQLEESFNIHGFLISGISLQTLKTPQIFKSLEKLQMFEWRERYDILQLWPYAVVDAISILFYFLRAVSFPNECRSPVPTQTLSFYFSPSCCFPKVGILPPFADQPNEHSHLCLSSPSSQKSWYECGAISQPLKIY